MRRAACALALVLPLGVLSAPPAQAVVCEPLIKGIPPELDPRCLAFYLMCRTGQEAGRLLGEEVYCVA